MFPDNTIEEIKTTLIRNKESVAVGESVTAGLLQAAIASAQDAIKFFQGGITTYNIGQKARHLNVDPVNAIARKSVSENIASLMAAGIGSMLCAIGLLLLRDMQHQFRDPAIKYLHTSPYIVMV